MRVVRRFNKRTTQLHDVKYPGLPTRTLHIIVDNLELARKGDEGMQAFFIRQYKSQVGVGTEVYLEWDKLSLVPVGIPVPPTPEIKKPNGSSTPGASRPRREIYGCTCERDDTCASCDQGWHQSCRYGCKYGQVVR